MDKKAVKFYVDADLEEFLESIGAGEKSRFINRLLRSAITIDMGLDERLLVRKAIACARTELDRLDYGAFGVQYKGYLDKQKETLIRLEEELAKNKPLKKGSEYIGDISETLMAAEVYMRNKGREFYPEAQEFLKMRLEFEEHMIHPLYNF